MSSSRHPNVLDAESTCLVVVDVQEKFRAVQTDFDKMLGNAVRLAKTFRILGLPILVTEQYPKGLGVTVPELSRVLSGVEPSIKTCFSSCGSEEFSRALSDFGRRQVLVCGIEAHVCVSQTVHDLLLSGYSVHVAVDAVESRKSMDRDVAIQKMERSGGVLTTSEMAAFELLRDAKHERFREVQALFK
jgi:nicotinamidase-related amidase